MRLSAASTPSAKGSASSPAPASASLGSATPTGLAPIAGADAKTCATPPLFTGYTRDGGYATHTIAEADFVFPLSDDLDPVETAPLLCAGLIGWRSLKLAGDGRAIGVYGFGAAGHIIAQVCRWQGRRVFAFTRPGDHAGQAFARSVGVDWAGGSDDKPPEPLDAAILFAPAGELVPAALAALRKGGRVVCGGIHMSDIPAFPYSLLWEERSVASVANLTRADGHEFLALAPEAKVRTTTTLLSARQGQRGARRFARRQARRRGGARALVVKVRHLVLVSHRDGRRVSTRTGRCPRRPRESRGGAIGTIGCPPFGAASRRDRRDRDRHGSVFFAHSTSDPERHSAPFRSSADP